MLTPQFSEFCIYAHAAKPTDETPRIEECIRLFNGVTTWVVSSILREFTMVKRAAVIDKFVECTRVSELLCWRGAPEPPSVLQHLFDLHAYNTLLAVVGGLNHFSIRRLAQTWAKVDKPRKEVPATPSSTLHPSLHQSHSAPTITPHHHFLYPTL